MTLFPPPPAIKEKDWQKTLVAALEALGWAVSHVYPLRTEHGWRTPTTLKGFPDLQALRGDWQFIIEAKSAVGRLDPDQLRVLPLFAALPNCLVYVLRPQDPWDFIVRAMQHPDQAPRTFGWHPAA